MVLFLSERSSYYCFSAKEESRAARGARRARLMRKDSLSREHCQIRQYSRAGVHTPERDAPCSNHPAYAHLPLICSDATSIGRAPNRCTCTGMALGLMAPSPCPWKSVAGLLPWSEPTVLEAALFLTSTRPLHIGARSQTDALYTSACDDAAVCGHSRYHGLA